MIIVRIKRFLNHKFWTGIFILKYWSLVRVESGAWLESRVAVKRFYNASKKIKVVLKKQSYIKSYTIIQGSGYFELGENSYISSFCVIGVNEKIIVGRNVMIADSVSLRDTDHSFDEIEIPMIKQGVKTAAINIEDDVWISHGAVITKGVTVGKGSIIAANAVVTKDIPPYSIAAGVPARIIKSRIKESI